MKKLLLLILLTSSFSAYSESNGNEIVKILNEEILTSYDQENYGEVDEFLMVYLDRCIDYTSRKVSNEVDQMWAKRNQRIRKLTKLSNEAENEYIKVVKGCYSSLDTDDLSEKLSCRKDKEKGLKKIMEARENLHRETSLIIDPANTTNYALGFCAYWYSEIKSKLPSISY